MNFTLRYLALSLIFLTCALRAQQLDSVSHKQRLGSAVNAYSAVVNPVLSYDEQVLYFSRKFYPENTGSVQDPDDIWASHLAANGTWQEAMRLGPPLNTPESDVLCSICPRSNTALVQTTIVRNGVSSHVFALSRLHNNTWSAPQAISIKNYRNDSRFFYAHLAFDERTLFLALDNPQSHGGLDLYVCFREDNSLNFSEPINLGSDINTKGTEGSPCLAFDAKTLYFSSDGHQGYGSQDLFVSRRLDSTWTHWSAPQNLGAEINTPYLDHCFSLNADGSMAMIVSADTLGTPGIYSVHVPAALQMGASVVDLRPLHDSPTSHDTLSFDLHFGVDSTIVSTNELRAALSAVRSTHEDRCWVISLDAWTDNSGTEAHNATLAQHRADAVRNALHNYLANQCFSIARVTPHGSHDSRFSNENDSGRAANRSVRVQLSMPPVKR